MTQQIVTAFFETRDQATEAITELVNAGIPRARIRLLPETDEGATSAHHDDEDKGFFGMLADMFFPDDDRYTYAEALNRGSTMVSVTAEDFEAERAEEILERYGTVNIDESERGWRNDGWTGYDSARTSDVMPEGLRSKRSRDNLNEGGEEAIPIVEERLQVGKRQVRGGRVMVRSYTIETPVTEDLALREETVNVERRAVDRALDPGEDAFRERTIEAEAVSEEAVVAKKARVTGEVVVKKAVRERTETVSDTVRSTEVEIEDDTGEVARRSASKRRR